MKVLLSNSIPCPKTPTSVRRPVMRMRQTPSGWRSQTRKSAFQAMRSKSSKWACEAHYHVVGKGTNGLEAITLVKTLKPQVLILDHHMPVMNGLEALRQIVLLRTTAVVLLTADQDPNVAREAMEIGAFGYVTK